MKISIITTDGGAGKTAIAFAIAKDFNYFLLSNDDSVIESAYPEMAKIMPNPKVIDDTVYDFGGFVNDGVIDIIKHSDIVIVPCINDLNSKMKAIKTINELSKYNNNFLVVATRLEAKNDFKIISEAIKKKFDNISILPLRKTKIFKNALEYGLSPLELVAESKQLAYSGRNIIPEYKAVLKHIINDEKTYNDFIKSKEKKGDK